MYFDLVGGDGVGIENFDCLVGLCDGEVGDVDLLG